MWYRPTVAKRCWHPVLGSPFAVEIADPGMVEVFGDGLESAQSGQKAVFMIDAGQPTNAEDVKVSISRKS